MNQLLLNISPEFQPAFENFLTGGNLELLSALRHALTNEGSERCFYLWGEAGCGKSHLLRACQQAALAAQHSASYSTKGIPEPATLVAIDDVERLNETEQIELFNLYNQMREAGYLLLVSGTQSPIHLALREDLRSRLGWGMVYQVHALNEAEKLTALMQHARLKGFTLPAEVAQYLLCHGRRDLRSMLAVLDALDLHTLRLHRAPTVPLLKQILQYELGALNESRFI